ncbi:unnamed protein product [Brugia timori]|uniref:Ovule protein n=1 Tax=Brugia timori TaxID=42155 RepID=A0A0R3QEN6_9BILA|nr:unnamed protein product [Brugia timori]
MFQLRHNNCKMLPWRCQRVQLKSHLLSTWVAVMDVLIRSYAHLLSLLDLHQYILTE